MDKNEMIFKGFILYLSKKWRAPDAFPANATLPSASSTSLSNNAISSDEG